MTPTPTTEILIPGPKTLLIGGTGSGKTHCLRTAVDAGFEVFALFTEPGMEVLADVPADKLHWHYIPPASPDWADMLDSATKINTMSLKTISGMEDINKRKYQGFMDLIKAMADFPDDRTGQRFGPVDKFGANRLFACPVVMIAHAERETDEVTGGSTIMASTLGKKLAPRLPRFFSDVINTKRDGEKFTWSTTTHNMDLKARNIPLADNQPPSLRPILESWRRRNAEALAARTPNSAPAVS
jgi:hypothetical protein